MANRVVINICGEELTFIAEESSSYMQRVGAYVNDKMAEVLDSSKVGRTDAAVLTAVNIADELFKAQAAAEQPSTPVGARKIFLMRSSPPPWPTATSGGSGSF